MDFKLFFVVNFSAGVYKGTSPKNAVSILFPYVRSQITLLTARPSFQSIILLPIDINALLDGGSVVQTQYDIIIDIFQLYFDIF